MAIQKITAAVLGNNAVTAANVAAGTLSAADLADNSITAAKIAQNQIGVSELNVTDGTNGQVLSTNGSGTLSFTTISGYTDNDVETYLNTSTIYTDATNNRLGVGQSSPQAYLHVYGTNAEQLRLEGNDEYTYLRFQGTPSGGSSSALGDLGFGNYSGTAIDLNIANRQNGSLTFHTGSSFTQRMTITNDGTMGFGMSPLGTNNGSAFFDGNVSSKDGFMTTGTNLQLIAPSAAATIFVRDNGNETMRINSNGTVGIGSGSRTDQMLMVQGAAPQIELINTSNSYAPLSFVNNTNTSSYNDIASIGAEIDSGNAKGRIVFKTRNTDGSGSQAERMRITSDGKVLIGDLLHFSNRTDSSFIKGDDSTGEISYYADQNHKFYVYEGGWKNTVEVLSTGQVRFQGDQTEGNGGYLSSWDDNSGVFSGGGYQTQSGFYWTSIRTSSMSCDSGLVMFYANYTGTANQINSITLRARINDSGNSGDFYTNDGTVSSLSDSRLKTNVQNLTDGLDILTQLRPVTFEYNDNSVDEKGRKQLGNADGVTRYGFIAQEVESVAPHYVNTETGMIGGEEVDDLKSMSQTRLIPMLVKSIQELNTKLEAAEARITELEG